jgi:predicted nucleic acid-binding Zn ribbon protein
VVEDWAVALKEFPSVLESSDVKGLFALYPSDKDVVSNERGRGGWRKVIRRRWRRRRRRVMMMMMMMIMIMFMMISQISDDPEFRLNMSPGEAQIMGSMQPFPAG